LGQTNVIAGEVRHPVLTGFSLSDFPTLEGYNALSSKVEQGSEDILLSASFSDPLLSAWQLGLGRVVAWMSDLGEDWSPDWRTWNMQGRFWTQVIRYALTDPSTGPAQAKVSVGASTVTVDLQIENDAGVPVNLAYPEFAYVGADSTVTKLSMQQVAPGSYKVEFPRPPEGAYRAVISYLGEAGISDVATPFVVDYPDELQPVDADAGKANLLRWAGMAGGDEITLEDMIVIPEEQAEVPPADILRWLLLTLVVFWPLEIAVRRRWLPWA
jgi:hypothetical protein